MSSTTPALTPAQFAARRRNLLALTIQQHALKRRVDLERAAIDEFARAQYDETHEATTYKSKGLGTIRLEERGGGPEAYVRDQAAFDSYIAERFPSESTATITMPAHQLEAALEALGFAEVDVTRSDVHTSSTSAAAVLRDLTIVNASEEDEEPAYEVFDDQGTSVPGVAVRDLLPELRLVVTADPAAKAKACDEADEEAARAAEQPVDEPVAKDETEGAA